LDSPAEKPAIQSEDNLLNILSSLSGPHPLQRSWERRRGGLF